MKASNSSFQRDGNNNLVPFELTIAANTQVQFLGQFNPRVPRPVVLTDVDFETIGRAEGLVSKYDKTFFHLLIFYLY